MSILLSLIMVFSVFAIVPISASAAEQMESFHLDDYKQWDDSWQEYFAIVHTGTNVSVAPTVGGMYVRNGGWYVCDDGIKINALNGYVITKLVFKNDFDYTCTLTAGGNNITGTKSGSTVTYENVNAAEAVFSSMATVLDIEVYYSEPELPEAIKDCTYQYGSDSVYANVPFDGGTYADLEDGAIFFEIAMDKQSFTTLDAMGYSYKFYDQTGTEITAEITDANLYTGDAADLIADLYLFYDVYGVTLPDGLEALYIVATAPEVADELADCTYSFLLIRVVLISLFMPMYRLQL